MLRALRHFISRCESPWDRCVRLSLLWCSLFTLGVRADVLPAAIFQDHLILQAGRPVAIWGQADPAEKILVEFAGQKVTATASADGSWKVALNSLAINAQPATLTFTGRNTIVIHDVLVGEVWLCSGQSNMEFKLSRAAQADAEIASANFPLIRQFQVRNKIAGMPQATFAGSWSVCSPTTAGSFTAVGYFFARDLTQRLGIPVAIINSSWGGTELEAWMSPASLAHPAFDFVVAHWQKRLRDFPTLQARYDAAEAEDDRKGAAARSRGETYTRPWRRAPAKPDGSPHEDQPSAIFNGMIHPLADVSLAGVLWYQGESNAGRAAEYRQLFPAFINGWRTEFQQPELAFYWVQLPNFHGSAATEDWAWLRDAQASALTLPATAQAITIDVGEVSNIHPLDKQDVGHRLALLALGHTYAQKVLASGPHFQQATFSRAEAQITFSEVESGLLAKGGTLKGFELAGKDHIFHVAEAQIEGDRVIVHSAATPLPVAVRYAWRNAPDATLFNGAGLPAAPFRSDSFPAEDIPSAEKS